MKNLFRGIEEYVQMKHALGFDFKKQNYHLKSFARFMKVRRKNVITADLALKWAKKDPKHPAWYQATLLSILRSFALHWATIERKTEVWPKRLLPQRYVRRKPYIYTSKEISELMAACWTLESSGSIRAHTFFTLFGLLAVTGMRLSEALDLKIDDVNLKDGILTVRRTKFNKTRFVSLDSSAMLALGRYKKVKEEIHPQSRSPFFLITVKDSQVRPGIAEWTFRKLAHQIGLRDVSSHSGARLHDLRHTFAVRTIEKWYREGADVDELMPILSTYMGHAGPSSTYWYLTITPGLMKLVRSRLEKFVKKGRAF